MTHTRLSRTSLLHAVKLVFRGGLFLVALAGYLSGRFDGKTLAEPAALPPFLWLVWLVFVVEMAFRFFPSRLESPGCQKQFAQAYRPRGASPARLTSFRSTFAVAAVWLALNGLLGLLFFTRVIDQGILLLISLAFSVCDMICILFFCPFQTWFMKNKCCVTCRIYNWDYAMMFTPLVFVPGWYTRSLLLCALALLARWEWAVRRHPERFSEEHNAALSCAQCGEKLCHHKKQLRRFLQTRRREKEG